MPTSRCRGRTRKSAPIVPSQNVAGRALVSVIAIMTFLSCLTLGAVSLVSDIGSRSGKARSPARRPSRSSPPTGSTWTPRSTTAARIASGFAGVREARIVDREATARLLEPWLGAGLDIDELPVPRLVIITIDEDNPPDFAQMRAMLTPEVPTAYARRPPHLGRPPGLHGAHDGDDRHGRAGADAVGDRAVGGVRHARRHGRQRPHHRGAAFRRRRGDASSPPSSAGISCSPA